MYMQFRDVFNRISLVDKTMFYILGNDDIDCAVEGCNKMKKYFFQKNNTYYET